MSLRRELEARARRLALSVLDDVAPGAVHVVEALEAWQKARDTIEAIETQGAAFSGSGGAAESTDDGDGDTVAVEITDERGRCVGWTTATVKR